jgi:hypothetical protein
MYTHIFIQISSCTPTHPCVKYSLRTYLDLFSSLCSKRYVILNIIFFCVCITKATSGLITVLSHLPFKSYQDIAPTPYLFYLLFPYIFCLCFALSLLRWLSLLQFLAVSFQSFTSIHRIVQVLKHGMWRLYDWCHSSARSTRQAQTDSPPKLC